MPTSPARTPATVPASAARALLLDGQQLLQNPARRATAASVHRLIERLGFVQLDTINVVERAHQHILFTRLDEYRPAHLTRLLERDRKLFEHWTHDASVIPIDWFRYWRLRFRRYRERGLGANPWWARRMGGEPERVIEHVRRRIEREGALMSKDFEHRWSKEAPSSADTGKSVASSEPSESGAWWGWKPQKAALEYLWRVGELSVAGRINFHKVYDLTERVFPKHHDIPAPEEEEHVQWACREALDRLGVATPGELVSFLNAVSSAQARRWCEQAAKAGVVVPVLVTTPDGSGPYPAFARADWEARVRRLPPPPERIRLLSPFDPLCRDRRRTERLFNFDYRFEAFVPAPKRRFGYYVLPILEGDRLIGRLDPKFYRDRGELVVNDVWWEPKIRPTRERRRRLEDAIDRLAGFVGAEHWSIAAAARA